MSSACAQLVALESMDGELGACGVGSVRPPEAPEDGARRFTPGLAGPEAQVSRLSPGPRRPPRPPPRGVPVLSVACCAPHPCWGRKPALTIALSRHPVLPTSSRWPFTGSPEILVRRGRGRFSKPGQACSRPEYCLSHTRAHAPALPTFTPCTRSSTSAHVHTHTGARMSAHKRARTTCTHTAHTHVRACTRCTRFTSCTCSYTGAHPLPWSICTHKHARTRTGLGHVQVAMLSLAGLWRAERRGWAQLGSSPGAAASVPGKREARAEGRQAGEGTTGHWASEGG